MIAGRWARLGPSCVVESSSVTAVSWGTATHARTGEEKALLIVRSGGQDFYVTDGWEDCALGDLELRGVVRPPEIQPQAVMLAPVAEN